MAIDNENFLLKDLVFVGRSNVGKSSLVNSILGIEAAMTSKTPGKTKEVTFYPMLRPHSRLVDCPGYGFARASNEEMEQWRKLMEIYLHDALTIQRVIFLVDTLAGV